MQQNQIQIAIDKGWDIEKTARLISKAYLLSTLLETANLDLNDYLKEYGLANEFRNDLNFIRKSTEGFHKKIKSLITPEMKLLLFKDYEYLDKLINDYCNTPPDEAKKPIFKDTLGPENKCPKCKSGKIISNSLGYYCSYHCGYEMEL